MPNALSPAWTALLDDYPTALAVSRDGALVAAGTASGSLYIFDASAGDLLHRLKAHEHGLLALAFGRRTLASGGQDGCAVLWNPREGTEIARLPGGGAWAAQLAYTPDGQRLAVGAGKQMSLWREDGSKLGAHSATAGINGLAWNAVGGLLAIVAGTEVQLWRAADGKPDRKLTWASTLLNACWSPDGKHLACGSLDKSVHFWRAGAWSDSRMGGYARKPQSLAWTGDSKWLATTGDDRLIVWNFSGKGPEGSKPLQLQGHVSPPSLVAAHGKHPWLLSGAEDRSLALWNLKAPEQPLGLQQLGAAVTALAFNNAAKLAYAADAEGRLFAYWLEL